MDAIFAMMTDCQKAPFNGLLHVLAISFEILFCQDFVKNYMYIYASYEYFSCRFTAYLQYMKNRNNRSCSLYHDFVISVFQMVNNMYNGMKV